MNKLLLVALGAAVLTGPALAGQPKRDSIQGVWQAVEVTITGPEARTIALPQPRANLTIFTARHYSQLHLDADSPRRVVDAAKATADELRALWGPFAGEAGTYELTGNTITMKPLVAKNPVAMAPGAFTTYAYALDGNMLRVTFQTNQNGPIVNPVTIKAVRVE